MKCRNNVGFAILSIFVLAMLKQGKYTNNVVHNQQNTFNLIRAGILQQTSLHISEVNTLHLTSRNLRNNFSRHKTGFATLHDKSKFKNENSWIQYGKEREDKALLVNAWLCIERNLNKRELVVYGQRRSTLKVVSILQLLTICVPILLSVAHLHVQCFLILFYVRFLDDFKSDLNLEGLPLDLI